MTKKDLLALVASIRVSNSKARRFVEQAAHNANPAINADLQHSPQLALEELEASAKFMQKVHDDLGTVASAVALLTPEQQERPYCSGSLVVWPI